MNNSTLKIYKFTKGKVGINKKYYYSAYFGIYYSIAQWATDNGML